MKKEDLPIDHPAGSEIIGKGVCYRKGPYSFTLYWYRKRSNVKENVTALYNVTYSQCSSWKKKEREKYRTHRKQ